MAEDLSETHDLAAEHPERVAELVELLVGRGRAEPGAPARQPGPVDARPPQARPSPRHAPASGTSPAGPRCPSRWPSTSATGPTPSTCDGRSCPTAWWPTACCSPSDPPSAAGRSTCSTAASATCTTSTARSATSSHADRRRSARVATPLAFTLREGRGPGRHGALCTVDGEVVAEGVIDRFTPAGLQRGGRRASPAATSGARPSARATARPSPSTGPSTGPRWRSTGPVVRDPLAELAAILAEQ